jgi:hypothetical protein
MWNLLAEWENEANKKEKVTIITNYYDPENKWVKIIAVRETGEFITSHISSFKSLNTRGFISTDRI